MTAFGTMTWNVVNFFRHDNGAEETRRIQRVDADVVALQEVGGEGSLEDL